LPAANRRHNLRAAASAGWRDGPSPCVGSLKSSGVYHELEQVAGPSPRDRDWRDLQKTAAMWNGEAVELTLKLMLAGRYEILRAPMPLTQAKELSDQLTAALDKAK
jgi:hypothetical protein